MSKEKTEPFIKLPLAVYESPEFQTLKPIDIAILLLLLSKFKGRNNGNISLGIREAARRCHCGKDTAARAFADLQKAGLISVTYKGHLVPEIGRSDVASRWRICFVTNATKTARSPNSGNSHHQPEGN